MKKIILDWLARIIVLLVAIEAVILLIYNPGQLLFGIIVASVLLGVRWAVVRTCHRWWSDEDEIKPIKAAINRTIGGVCMLLAIAVLVTAPKQPTQAQYYSTYSYGPTYASNNNTSFNNQNVGGMEAFGYQTMGQYIWSVLKNPFTWYGAGGISHMFDRNEDPGQAFWNKGQSNSNGRQP